MSKQKPYSSSVCRGCWSLGNNCGHCQKCIDTAPNKEKHNEGIDEIIVSKASGSGWVTIEHVVCGSVRGRLDLPNELMAVRLALALKEIIKG